MYTGTGDDSKPQPQQQGLPAAGSGDSMVALMNNLAQIASRTSALPAQQHV
jgi:hypothetical protein